MPSQCDMLPRRCQGDFAVTKRTLTDRAIKSLGKKPAKPGKTYDVPDAIVPGLAVRVMPSGLRSFVLITRFPGRRNPTRRSLGAYGAITLDTARERARVWLDLIRRGIDPRVEEERQRTDELRKQAHTFAAVAEEFIKVHVSKTRQAAAVELSIRKEFIARWGERPIAGITWHDILTVIDAAVGRGAPYQAHNLLAYAKSLFNWAVSRPDYGLETSPCDRLKPKQIIGKKQARQRILSDAEIRALWSSAETMGYPYGPLIKLLLITGQRLNEVARASWGEFDLDKRLWSIPAERMKAGAAHTVPLTAEAIKVLQELPRFKGDRLFSTTYGEVPVNGFSKAKNRLDDLMAERLGTVEEFRFHDIRRTMRTGLSALPVPDMVRELVIAHAQPGLHKVYDQHKYDDEKRHALNLWAVAMRDIVEPAPVVALSKARAER
jgi:integrase